MILEHEKYQEEKFAAEDREDEERDRALAQHQEGLRRNEAVDREQWAELERQRRHDTLQDKRIIELHGRISKIEHTMVQIMESHRKEFRFLRDMCQSLSVETTCLVSTVRKLEQRLQNFEKQGAGARPKENLSTPMGTHWVNGYL